MKKELGWYFNGINFRVDQSENLRKYVTAKMFIIKGQTPRGGKSRSTRFFASIHMLS